ncbi:MAG: FAD-binding protein [Bacteroidales bacterium]|nr:FAD-binding protein [Bacteroidales bacterium]
MEVKKNYDYIIIGSGFGGAVSALRLTEKGYKVLVIEKGKWFRDDDFPKNNWNIKKWLWAPSLKFFGIQKLSFFRHLTILSGVGVGGGSLVYANTLPKPKKAFYNSGSWSTLANWENELEDHYNMAHQMLGATTNPYLGTSDLAFQKLSKEIGKENNFEATKVAVYFGEPEQTVDDPYFDGKGPTRTSCTFCGACMTGCRHNAKNTLDKNYLYLAQQLGASILSENEVVDVQVNKTGYQVSFKSSTSYFSKTKTVESKGIIFSAGVLGTIPLLLKLKNKSLPKLSKMVGHDIRSNNEALIGNITFDKSLDMSDGVAIGSIIDLDENSHIEPVRYGHGSGFWKILMAPMISEKNMIKRLGKLLIFPFLNPVRSFKMLFTDDFAKRASVILFMQHLDSTLLLQRNIFGGLKTKIGKGKAPTAFIPEAHSIAKKYSKIINGESMVLATETISGIPSTAHILGGAVMGKDTNNGVIDKDNKVFGYENMYVCDGSMISANPGVNPSLSITAIAERAMSRIAKKN